LPEKSKLSLAIEDVILKNDVEIELVCYEDLMAVNYYWTIGP
jgi:hypothetical protein